MIAYDASILQPFQPVVSPSPNAIAGWMTNANPSLPHAAVAQGPPGLVQAPNTGMLKGIVLNGVAYQWRCLTLSELLFAFSGISKASKNPYKCTWHWLPVRRFRTSHEKNACRATRWGIGWTQDLFVFNLTLSAFSLLNKLRFIKLWQVSFSGASHPANMYTQEDLPKQLVRTLNQGSNVMSLDFHPVQQTILLGTCWKHTPYLSNCYFG